MLSDWVGIIYKSTERIIYSLMTFHSGHFLSKHCIAFFLGRRGADSCELHPYIRDRCHTGWFFALNSFININM